MASAVSLIHLDFKHFVIRNGEFLESEYQTVPALPLDKIYLKEVLHILYGSERKEREDIRTMGEAVAQELEDNGIKGLEDISIENLMERL